MSRVSATLILSFFLFGVAAAGQPRFVPLGQPVGPAVDWITADRSGILAGSNQRLYRATLAGEPALRAERSLGGDVGDAVAVGSRLLLVRDGRRLAIVDHDGADPVDLRVVPRARGKLTPAVAGDILVLAEDGRGVRFRQILSSHHHGHFELAPIVRLPLAETFTAAAADGTRAFVATLSDLLYEIDFSVPGAPRVVSRLELDGPVDALAANGERLLALGGGVLTLFERDGSGLVVVERVAGVRGSALQMNGRVFYAAGPHGVQAWRDRSEGAQTHAVTLGNDFFSPASLVVETGDRVEWTNAALGGYHNVESCVPTINGCDGQTATESFTSGAVAGPIWSYSYSFAEAGTNDYVCISHLPFMTGTIHVGGIRVPWDDIHPTLPSRSAPNLLRY